MSDYSTVCSVCFPAVSVTAVVIVAVLIKKTSSVNPKMMKLMTNRAAKTRTSMMLTRDENEDGGTCGDCDDDDGDDDGDDYNHDNLHRQ